ncbi:hypothetical protein JN00_0555 [Metamycoplasma subdolum]|uniref:Lipoprotein n=1 Tax=Metamycoplasma subdolum TaxID=92407 RepID=A0A3M0A4Q2_9BACT|nr:hypothetical protein [Metamycoplasma subdolum]RMA77445.1 hypothetical protein JN00_0555 [Metamycoplasma subdolum]WPB50326.1 hypothetical protein R9C05_01820 [Metamycoplasma subdolum]
MKKWKSNLILLSSLSLLPATLISSSCMLKEKKTKREIEKIIGDKIWEYDAVFKNNTPVKINKTNFIFKDYFHKFAIGKLEKLEEYYKDYLVLDIHPTWNVSYFKSTDETESKKDNTIAIILKKEFGQVVGLYKKIDDNWKEQIKNWTIMKLGWMLFKREYNFSFNKEDKTLAFNLYHYSIIYGDNAETMTLQIQNSKFSLDERSNIKSTQFKADLIVGENLQATEGISIPLDAELKLLRTIDM